MLDAFIYMYILGLLAFTWLAIESYPEDEKVRLSDVIEMAIMILFWPLLLFVALYLLIKISRYR